MILSGVQLLSSGGIGKFYPLHHLIHAYHSLYSQVLGAKARQPGGRQNRQPKESSGTAKLAAQRAARLRNTQNTTQNE